MLWALAVGVILITCLIVDNYILEREFLRTFTNFYRALLSLSMPSFSVKSLLAAVNRWLSSLRWSSSWFLRSGMGEGYDELLLKYRAALKEKASLKLECDRLRAVQALSKADNEAASETHIALVQKHIQTRFLAKKLTARNESLAEELDEAHVTTRKRTCLLQTSLNLLALFWHYVQMATRRNRHLTDSLISLHDRISKLLTSNLALRKKYLEVEETLSDTRESVNDLALRLVLEESAGASLRNTVQDLQLHNSALLEEKKILEDNKPVLEEALSRSTNDSQFFQALSKSVVARYDQLQTEYGNLLVKHDLIKSDIFAFCDDLNKVASHVQDAQDLAEIGLNDLQRSVKPLKTKQDLLKIGQALALVRLAIAELMHDMTSLDGRDASASFGEGSSLLEGSLCTPGSIEDAVRKIKKLYEANESTENFDNSSFFSDDGFFKTDTPDDSSIASSTHSLESSRRLRPMMEGIQRILCQIEKRESSNEEFKTLLDGLEDSPKFRRISEAPRSELTADNLAELLTSTPLLDNSFNNVQLPGAEIKDNAHERRPSRMRNASQRIPKMVNAE